MDARDRKDTEDNIILHRGTTGSPGTRAKDISDDWISLLDSSNQQLFTPKWQPTPGFLPGKSHGWSLVGYSPWGCKELDTTERRHLGFGQAP